jgi:hypothetical protein
MKKVIRNKIKKSKTNLPTLSDVYKLLVETKKEVKNSENRIRTELLGEINNSESRVRIEFLGAIKDSESRVRREFVGAISSSENRIRTELLGEINNSENRIRKEIVGEVEKLAISTAKGFQNTATKKDLTMLEENLKEQISSLAGSAAKTFASLQN